MTIYLDNDFCAHVAQNESGTYIPWEDEYGFFDGKCRTFIEGYRVIPYDETWTRDDGITFSGLMITPNTPLSILKAAQIEYENNQAELADAKNALAILGVTDDE